MKKPKKRNGKKIQFPWQKPKSKLEDPNAEKLIKEIMKNPSYQLLEENISFIGSNEARGIRLQLDYLRAEVKLREEHIEHTIVVFGSARIVEYNSALKNLKEVEKKLERSPQSKTLLSKLHISERMVEKSTYYDEARKFGRLVGLSGKGPQDCRIALMTGGGPGIMEAANRGAFDVGAKSIGLNIELPHEQFPNPYITPDLCFQFHYFAIRKLHFMQRAKALVVFPGGFGTLDELTDILTLIQTHKTPPIPVVLVSGNYWNKVIDFNFLVDEGVITSEDLNIFIYVESAHEAWQEIKQWYKDNGIFELL